MGLKERIAKLSKIASDLILLSSGPYSLPSNSTIDPFSIIISIGTSLSDLKKNMEKGITRLHSTTSYQEPKSAARFFVDVYPNPAEKAFKVELVLNESNNVKMELFDLQGSKIETYIDENMVSGKHLIELSMQSNIEGICILKVVTGNTTFSRKVLVCN